MRTVLWTLLLAAAALGGGASAQAAAQLSWSAPASLPVAATPTSVSCASESQCVAVDEAGEALASADPTAGAPSWTRTTVDALAEGPPLTGVSCIADGSCVAVDAHGNAFVSFLGRTSTWSRATVEHGAALTGVSCASSSLCVAVDEAGEAWTNEDTGLGVWTPQHLAGAHAWTAISCAPVAPTQHPTCVAVDDSGNALSSADPAAGGWHLQKIDSAALTAVACVSAGECVATDAEGQALASADPTAAAATWSATPLDPGQRLAALSCAPTGLCAALGADGRALVSDDATAAIPEWVAANADTGHAGAGVSCLSGGFCLALDAAGRSFAARAGAPVATTLAAPEVSATSATLAGVVEARDALPSGCTFEWGAAGEASAYPHSQPCALLPSAIAGGQEVSAQLTGLEPDTSYHYRLTAASPAGVGTGAPQSFTTPFSALVPLVTPSPSITGTPAVGQRLTCHANVPTGVSVQLAYAWVRDQIVLPGTSSTVYAVKGQDSGHHLQCQVTATDGGGSATKRSSFVTIPMGGAPVSAGETSVGRASVARGRVYVPIACSREASGGCVATVRVSVAETVAGHRVLAVGAGAGARVAGSSRRTLTLASAHVRLAAGAHASVAAPLGKDARRLLAGHRRFTADVFVSGTVIGVIQAPLSRQLVTLTASAARASGHARPRR